MAELILNRYRPLGEAGTGGYGTVVVAWDLRIQRRVAIKQIQLDPDVIPAPMQGATYDVAEIPGLDEARTAALLADSNIVGILDFEIQENIAYLIMEYIDGCTLTQLMRDYPDDITLDIVAAVFKAVSHALQVAHNNQVLHLDIKPDNVLINRRGEVKVTDFGLSRLSNPDGYLKATGGTIGYMPLEQMNLEALDARCDEWSLAAVTYEMIAQENPFHAQDLKAAPRAIQDAELVLPSLCMEGLDTQADDVLFYALSPDRDDRYESVKDFADELLPFLGNPKTGQRQLARLVGAAAEDMEDAETPPADVAPIERMGRGNKALLLRLWAVVNCGFLGAVGASCVAPSLGGLSAAPFWGLVALVVVAAAAIPHVGALLAVGVFAAALLVQGAYLAGAALLVADLLWWFFSGRHGYNHANAPLSAVPLGAFGLGAVTPILCGYFLRIKDAALGTAFAALVALALAGSGAETLANWSPFGLWTSESLAVSNSLGFAAIRGLVTNPILWIDLVSWLLAAVTFAGMCTRGNRGLGFAGAVLAGAIILFAALLKAFVASAGATLLPPMADLLRAVVPLVVGGALAILGIPLRDEDEL